MIAYLRGEVLEKNGGRVILLAGGVGYDVSVPISTYAALPEAGGAAELRIYTRVSEDAIALYGFRTALEKLAFEKLISVSGIGPALAVKVLSGCAVETLAASLRNGDVAMLTRIPGVGKKTAERMILELKDKLDELPQTGARPAAPVSNLSPLEQDVLSALINLGSNPSAAEAAVAKAKLEVKGADFEALFRRSLELVR